MLKTLSEAKKTILSVLPMGWGCSRVENKFGVSGYCIWLELLKMVNENGIHSSPNAKPGKTLYDSTVQIVVDFYNREDVTRA